MTKPDLLPKNRKVAIHWTIRTVVDSPLYGKMETMATACGQTPMAGHRVRLPRSIGSPVAYASRSPTDHTPARLARIPFPSNDAGFPPRPRLAAPLSP